MSGQDQPTENNHNWEEPLIDLFENTEAGINQASQENNEFNNSLENNISLEEDLNDFLSGDDSNLEEDVDISQLEWSNLSLEDDNTQDLLPFIQNNNSLESELTELPEFAVANTDNLEWEPLAEEDEENSLGALLDLEDLVGLDFQATDNAEIINENDLETNIELLDLNIPSLYNDLGELDGILDESDTTSNSLNELEGLLDSAPEENLLESNLSESSLDDS